MRVGALIAEGDLQRLLGQARSFVDKGFRVKLVVRFGHWQRANGEERLRAVVEQVGKKPWARTQQRRSTRWLCQGWGGAEVEQVGKEPWARTQQRWTPRWL